MLTRLFLSLSPLPDSVSGLCDLVARQQTFEKGIGDNTAQLSALHRRLISAAATVVAAVVVVAAAAYVTTYWASSSVRTHLPICPPPIPVRIRTFHGTKPWLVTITLSVFEIMRNRIQPSWEYKKYLWWSSTIGSTSFVCLQNDQLLTTEL